MLRKHPWEMHPTNFESREEWKQLHDGRKFVVCLMTHQGRSMREIGNAIGVSHSMVGHIRYEIWTRHAEECGLDPKLGGKNYLRFMKWRTDNANRSMEDTKREMVLDL